MMVKLPSEHVTATLASVRYKGPAVKYWIGVQSVIHGTTNPAIHTRQSADWVPLMFSLPACAAATDVPINAVYDLSPPAAGAPVGLYDCTVYVFGNSTVTGSDRPDMLAGLVKLFLIENVFSVSASGAGGNVFSAAAATFT